MSELLQLPDAGIMQIVRQLRAGYGLKRTLRYQTARDRSVHSESVAEHVFALHYLAQYFALVERLPQPLDMLAVHRLITFHDFGEIINGDKPYHLKTAEDEERERRDAAQVFASLPMELGALAKRSWEEYERQEGIEARFVCALDKIEPIFELLDEINERSLKRLKFTWEDHINKKRQATRDFPVMRRFVEVTGAHMRARGVFWTTKTEAAE